MTNQCSHTRSIATFCSTCDLQCLIESPTSVGPRVDVVTAPTPELPTDSATSTESPTSVGLRVDAVRATTPEPPTNLQVGFSELVLVPHRKRSTKKRRSAPPSYHLTSDEHISYVGVTKKNTSTKEKKKKPAEGRTVNHTEKKKSLDESKMTGLAGKKRKSAEGRKVMKRKEATGKKKKNSAETQKMIGSEVLSTCSVCKITEKSPEDVRPWIACHACSVWYHEPCGEQYGILDDDNFTCQNCL